MDVPGTRYEIRAALPDDIEGVLELAEFLDTVNLPHDREEVGRILEHSRQSFSGEIADPRYRQYVFALHDHEERRIVGTSMIVGQLGRRDAPYIYLNVREEERYSASLDKHFVHPVLSIAYSYDGPTEIGGLIMNPAYRRSGARLGLQISYVRFLFMAVHRQLFQNHVLAELLPPLEEDGTSHLWEAVGRRFTGLSYQEADRLSKHNKEFIRGLFPNGDLYATLFSEQARAVIGEVGPQTRGVRKMLERIGFRYVERVDPFDGGPHYAARIDDVTLVRDTRTLPIEPADDPVEAPLHLVALEWDRPPYFSARVFPAQMDLDRVHVARAHLELWPDDVPEKGRAVHALGLR